MLASEPVPARPHEQDLVQASLVHGQIKGPPLLLPQGALDESGPGIGMQIDHIMEPDLPEGFLHLCCRPLDGPDSGDARQPFHGLGKGPLRQEVHLDRPVQQGMQGTDNR